MGKGEGGGANKQGNSSIDSAAVVGSAYEVCRHTRRLDSRDLRVRMHCHTTEAVGP